MESVKIESIAVNAVNNEIDKYNVLVGNLQKNDRGVSLDGYISLYLSEKLESKNFLGNIPVQIKGKVVRTFSDNKRNYQIKITDLQNYINDGKGIVYFVVEILPSIETKIFYNVLSIEKINKYLKDVKSNQQTKNIVLDELKNGDLVSIITDLYNTWKNTNIIIEKNTKNIIVTYSSSKDDVIEKSRIEEIEKENKPFIPTTAYIEVQNKLKKDSIVLIHGEPWVGKTTIANELVKEYYQNGYKFIYGRANELEKVEEKIIEAKDKKIICLIDDFLGSNVNSLKNSERDGCLNDLIIKFKNNAKRKLILTTRTYIYNNAKELFHKFYQCTENIDEILVDAGNYTSIEKAKILYSHLEKNNILWSKTYVKLIEDEFYKRVISHTNFNPGLIAHICETINEIESNQVLDYIQKLLDNPSKIWEIEYKKLTLLEKILLNIIVLFGYENYEQDIKNQFLKMVIDKNTTELQIMELENEYNKALSSLTISFVSVGFNKETKMLDTCKHSIRDYVISKFKNREIDITNYIEKAQYSDMLHYMSLYFEDINEIISKISKKVEKDFYSLKENMYDKTSVCFSILKENLTVKGEKLIKKIIKEAFETGNKNAMIFLLERDEKDEFYEYILEQFKKYELENLEYIPYFFDDPHRILPNLDSSFNMNLYLKACYNCTKKVNHKFMLDRIYDLESILVTIIFDEVVADITEVIPQYTLELIEEGNTIEEITKLYAIDIIKDEVPSLKLLYSDEIYENILDHVSEECIISEWDLEDYGVDLDEIKETVKKEKDFKNNTYEDNERYIKELFEGKNIVENVKNVITYINKNYNISECELRMIAYESFRNGIISEKTLDKNLLKKMIEYQILEKDDDKVKFGIRELQIYLAIKEMISRKENLFEFINIWFDEEFYDFLNELKNIFFIYEIIDKNSFDRNVAIPLLQLFVRDMEKYNNIIPIDITKKYFKKTETSMLIDQNGKKCEISRTYEADWILEYLGADMHIKLEEFEYKSITYDNELESYKVDFYKMISTKNGIKELENLGICEYIYKIYLKSKELLNDLQNAKKINLQNYFGDDKHEYFKTTRGTF